LEGKGSREKVSWWVVGQYYVLGFAFLLASCLFIASKNLVPCRGSLVQNDQKYEWGEILGSSQGIPEGSVNSVTTSPTSSTPTLYFHRDEMLRLGYSHVGLQSVEVFGLAIGGVFLTSWVLKLFEKKIKITDSISKFKSQILMRQVVNNHLYTMIILLV
jgi:hypothetical protein